MIAVRAASERGHTNLGWLDSYHTFSFGDYYDPAHTGFRALRVINEDRVQPGKGFGTHSHRDMEILSYVLEGALEHRDSLGTGSVIRPGEVQMMSAGSGVSHSEFNPSRTDPVHFLQIWILPERKGLQPAYQQRDFASERKTGRLLRIASRDGRESALAIHQDANLYAALLATGQEVAHRLEEGRHAWVQVARGGVKIQDATLRAGDGAAISGVDRIAIEPLEPSEILLFDLA